MASKETSLMTQLLHEQQWLLDLELHEFGVQEVLHTDDEERADDLYYTLGEPFWTVVKTSSLAAEVRCDIERVAKPKCAPPWGTSSLDPLLMSGDRVVALRVWAPKLGLLTAYPSLVWRWRPNADEPVQRLAYRFAVGRDGECAARSFNSAR